MNPSILEKYNALPTGIKKQVEDFIDSLPKSISKILSHQFSQQRKSTLWQFSRKISGSRRF